MECWRGRGCTVENWQHDLLDRLSPTAVSLRLARLYHWNRTIFCDVDHTVFAGQLSRPFPACSRSMCDA
jgi:hypothetical protein